MLHGSSPRYIHARPLPGTGLDAVPIAWLPAHPRYETMCTPNGGAPRTILKPIRSGQEYAAALPFRLSLPSRRVAEATVHQGATASCTPTPAADASVDSAKLARLEEELRCARSELKALQVEWLAKRPEDGSERFPSVRAVPEGLPPDPVEQHSAERPEIPAQASSSSGDPLAALAAVWSGTQEDVSQATCHPSALPEDSVPESRREATGPSVPEADAVDGPEAQREDSVDSPVGVLPADVLSGSPVSEVDHRPEENAFDGSGPDVPGVQSASVMSEVQAQVGDAADAPAESDVGHLEAAAPAAEPLGPAELDPSEAGSNSAWVSTAAPNPLASSEGDPEEDAAAAATSGDEDPEAGASTARVSTAAPFPSRMMTDIASSESELQEVASSVASEAEQLEVRPSQMTSEDVSNQQATSSTWQADHQWPATVELAPSPVAASAAWPAFESQDAQRDTRGAASKPQVTWQSPGTDMERLAASVEKLTEEMRAKWSLLDDLTHRLSQVEQSLRVSSNAKVEELEERVDQLERQLKAMESQNGLNGELAEVDHNEAPSHRGQHQVWL